MFKISWSVLGVLIVIAAVFRVFVISRVTVPDGGMEPYVMAGSTHWLYKFAYSDVGDVKAGDIVVINARPLGAPYDSLVLRVVALPDDAVEIAPGQPVMVNALPIAPMIVSDLRVTKSFVSEALPQDHVFAIGSSCCSKWDSYGLGPIPFSAVRGKLLH